MKHLLAVSSCKYFTSLMSRCLQKTLSEKRKVPEHETRTSHLPLETAWHHKNDINVEQNLMYTDQDGCCVCFFSNTKAPITPPTIFFNTVSISEYDFTVKTFILSTCLTDRFFMKLEFCSHAYDFQLFPTQAFSLHVVKT